MKRNSTNNHKHKNNAGRLSQDNKDWANTNPLAADSEASRHEARMRPTLNSMR